MHCEFDKGGSSVSARTKLSFVAILLAATSAAPLFADAKSKPPKPAATMSVSVARQEALKQRIRKSVGAEFADRIFQDPRFTFDENIYAPKKNVTPQKHDPRRWTDYDYALSPEYIQKARNFLETQKAVFDAEQAKFGVPKEVIVAILVVETKLGERLGKGLVIQTLWTRAVFQTRLQRPAAAERELIAFLLICKKNNFDPFTIPGSSTGAFGLPQFEPSSYTILAARYANDGKPPNLFDPADAIWSVGNFLSRAGWNKNTLTHEQVALRYNKQLLYASAVLDCADTLSGKSTKHHHYVFAHRQPVERAATK
jgi:membrane-bound lytic murein transglycosylase B